MLEILSLNKSQIVTSEDFVAFDKNCVISNKRGKSEITLNFENAYEINNLEVVLEKEGLLELKISYMEYARQWSKNVIIFKSEQPQKEFHIPIENLCLKLKLNVACEESLKIRIHKKPEERYDVFNEFDPLGNEEYKNNLYNTFTNYKYITSDKKYEAPQKIDKNVIGESIQDGKSMLVCIKNRTNILKQNIDSWLKTGLDELIVLDWSSDEKMIDYLMSLRDKRIRYVYVNNEPLYVRTYAQNLGASLCKYNKIMKMDADTIIKQTSFFEDHKIQQGEFFVGDFMCSRDENEKATHGLVYLHTNDYFRVNGYNEKIKDYGWDDSDFTIRLLLSGMKKKLFDLDSLYHVPHDNNARVAHCKRINPNILIQLNKELCRNNPLWDNKFKRQEFEINRLEDCHVECTRKKSVEYNYENEEQEKALQQSIERVFSWLFLSKSEIKEEHKEIMERKDHEQMLRCVQEITF